MPNIEVRDEKAGASLRRNLTFLQGYVCFINDAWDMIICTNLIPVGTILSHD